MAGRKEVDWQEMLDQEMALSESIVAKGVDVVPRFRIVTPEGEYQVLVQMRDDPLDRLARLKLVAAFMAWKFASGFVVSGEHTEPAGIFSFAVSASSVEGVFRSIERDADGKLIVGQPIKLDQAQCDPEFVLMLPDAAAAIDAETLALVEKVFGLGGELEARPVN
jgi:hypothetical protein